MNPNKIQSTLNKGLIKDIDASQLSGEYYTHARNAVNNSHEGQVGLIQNEPSNLHCVNLPYTLIGAIHTTGDQWVLFTTDNEHSEIGLFDDSQCSYTKIVNDSCLNFSTSYLITGASRRTSDCSIKVYWSDALNPDRFIDINAVPYITNRVVTGSCVTEVSTGRLDCEKIRLTPLLDIPCLSLSRATSSGTLLNGTYQVAVAYAISSIRCTDYLIVSNPISVWDHGNVANAIELTVSNTDVKEFDEMEVVVIYTVNGQTQAKRLGIYSTSQGSIYIDSINNELPNIPLENIPLQTPAIEKSDGIYEVGNYLLRAGIYTKSEFNYQPLANQIETKWVSVRYPENYYHKAGKNVGYMRDEVYSFFIRWVYNTGEKSKSYHIPCNVSNPQGFTFTNGTTDDGGTLVTTGYTQPYLSSEKYPDNKPAIWGNLCGQQIRHHRLPDNTVDNHFENGGNSIRVLGVQFKNIKVPVDNAGNPISSIVGYEILRGSREGNKSVIAKGMVKNMRTYNIPGSNQTGLFQNYPYNDLRVSRTTNITKEKFSSIPVPSIQSFTTSYHPTDGYILNTQNGYSRNVVSFHSPDTTFNHPYLPGSSTFKLYEELQGTSVGKFEVPYRHPEFKVLGPGAEGISNLVSGISTITTTLAGALGFDMKLTGTEDLPFQYPLTVNPSIPADFFGASAFGSGADFSPMTWIMTSILITSNAIVLGATAAMRYAVTREQMLRVFTALVSPTQFAKQYNSHGFYFDYRISTGTYNVNNASYIKGNIQSVGGYRVNNVFRNDYVLLELNGDIPTPVLEDKSRFTLGEVNSCDDPTRGYNTNISSFYGAIKVNLASQYGQLDSIKQVPISSCVHGVDSNPQVVLTSPVLFGGDTYINRYTEKNPFLFFNDWLIDQSQDYTYNYRQYYNIPSPLYWVDNRKVFTDFLSSVSDYRSLECENYSGLSGDGKPENVDDETGTASGSGFDPIDIKKHFKKVEDIMKLAVKRGNFYLFCNGVHDFFVESDVNVGYRDWDDDVSKRFYDPYGYADTTEMFRSDVIKSPGFYKYDYSLSVSKFYNQYISWGTVQGRDYDPLKAESCYDYYPRRVIYSLPQVEELKKDNWRTYLVNNYKDFGSSISSIKQVGGSGALVMMNQRSPVQFVGADTLNTGAGVKVTVGDGGLFNQPLQSITNSDASYEYGSCQGKYAVAATPAGIYWVSQDQGKIFNFNGSLDEISRNGWKYWFAKYLPSQLLQQFPDFQLKDNPVKGVGVIMAYDNTNEVLYITKRDYRLKDGKSLRYGSEDRFDYTLYDSNDNPISSVVVTLCNREFFEDVSWTVSYDVKTKTFISHHDWHPDFIIPAKNHFLTAYRECPDELTSLWKHNVRCDSYCKFYDQQYPFELEFVSNTGENITTMRNVEYLLECYRYKNNCIDKYHVLDFNFDSAQVYNSEQHSGLLKLNLKTKNNPIEDLKYPIITPNYTEIPYSKEEQKYRFNMFSDLVNDRGEFTGLQVSLFDTANNGYIKTINPVAIDYSKSPLQRKKFRHYSNRVFLSKFNSADVKMIFKLSNTGFQLSNR